MRQTNPAAFPKLQLVAQALVQAAFSIIYVQDLVLSPYFVAAAVAVVAAVVVAPERSSDLQKKKNSNILFLRLDQP